MNRIIHRMIITENNRIFTLAIIMIVSLILSAFIFAIIGQGELVHISYSSISELPYLQVLGQTLKRNIVYFLAIIFLTFIGKSLIIKGLFGLISVFYGLSIIYLIKIVPVDKLYFIYNFTDYFIFFPILFYFTYISLVISKHIKKVETKSFKFDIITLGYLRISLFYVLVIVLYTVLYSYYIIILSRMMIH